MWPHPLCLKLPSSRLPLDPRSEWSSITDYALPFCFSVILDVLHVNPLHTDNLYLRILIAATYHIRIVRLPCQVFIHPSIKTRCGHSSLPSLVTVPYRNAVFFFSDRWGPDLCFRLLTTLATFGSDRWRPWWPLFQTVDNLCDSSHFASATASFRGLFQLTMTVLMYAQPGTTDCSARGI